MIVPLPQKHFFSCAMIELFFCVISWVWTKSLLGSFTLPGASRRQVGGLIFGRVLFFGHFWGILGVLFWGPPGMRCDALVLPLLLLWRQPLPKVCDSGVWQPPPPRISVSVGLPLLTRAHALLPSASPFCPPHIGTSWSPFVAQVLSAKWMKRHGGDCLCTVEKTHKTKPPQPPPKKTKTKILSPCEAECGVGH